MEGHLSELWSHEVRHGLWLGIGCGYVSVGEQQHWVYGAHTLVAMAVISMIVSVWVLSWSDVLHLDDVSALATTLNGAFAGDHHPQLVMAISRNAGATDIMLVAEGFDETWILHGACDVR
jgi:hypothetical protein